MRLIKNQKYLHLSFSSTAITIYITFIFIYLFSVKLFTRLQFEMIYNFSNTQ